MVRLMLVLAPVMCILSGIAVSSLLNIYMPQVDQDSPTTTASATISDKKKVKQDGNFFMRGQVILTRSSSLYIVLVLINAFQHRLVSTFRNLAVCKKHNCIVTII